jgi:hypothetical protein
VARGYVNPYLKLSLYVVIGSDKWCRSESGPARKPSIAFHRLKDREITTMNAETATGCRIFRSGRLLTALAMLFALAACTDTPHPTTTTASAGPMSVAGGNAGTGGTHSVDAVSDALGQRLDGMLGSRAPGGAAR